MKTPSLHSLAVLFFLAAIGHCYSQDKPFVPPATARPTFDFNVGWKFLRSDGKAVDVCKVRTGFHKAEYKGGAGGRERSRRNSNYSVGGGGRNGMRSAPPPPVNS